ncbi:MAG: hypothetical protein HYX54_01830 [Chloroflexi bacterium]|nr:hypothetical protein [Chloroflexota bacterium]
MIQMVETSTLTRTLVPQMARDAGRDARLVSLQLRAAGGSGVVWIACGPECELREDIDGMSLDVTGSDVTSSDATRFEAFCSGVSGDNAGVAVRFVFVPAPAPTTTRLRVSFSPFPPSREGNPEITLEADIK